jgi:hypothetical protein
MAAAVWRPMSETGQTHRLARLESSEVTLVSLVVGALIRAPRIGPWDHCQYARIQNWGNERLAG